MTRFLSPPASAAAVLGADLAVRSITVLPNSPYTNLAAVGEIVTAVNPYNVKAYGAKLDGVTDDTAAWYNGSTGALDKIPATGGVATMPPGISLVSSPLTPKTKTGIQGAGSQLSIIKATAAFGGSGNRGIIDFTAALYVGNSIQDLQIDNSGITYGATNVSCIHQAASGTTVQHFSCRRVWMEMSGNVHSIGITMEGLGGVAGATSYDLTYEDIFGHNGSGTILLYGNFASGTSAYHTVFCQNIFSLIDVNGISDDRVAFIGNQGSAFAGNPEARDMTARGIYTTITSAVTSGSVNGFKIDSGSVGQAYVHDVTGRDIFYRNYGSGISNNNPVSMLLGSASFLQDVFLDNIEAINSGAIIMRMARFENVPTMTLTNFKMKGTLSSYNVECYCSTNAVGDENLMIRNGALHNANGVAGNTPTGILLASGAAGQGGSGLVLIDGVQFSSFSLAVTNNLNESLSAQATAWSNIHVTRCGFFTVTTRYNFVNTWAAPFNSPAAAADRAFMGAGMLLGGNVPTALAGDKGRISTDGTNMYIEGTGAGNMQLRPTIASSVGLTIDLAGHLFSINSGGAPGTSNLGANVTSVTFTGNDRRGTIAIVMSGALAANTRLATCTNATSYGAAAPFVFLINETSGAGLVIVNFYRQAVATGVSFDLACDQALAAGTYTIGYIVEG